MPESEPHIDQGRLLVVLDANVLLDVATLVGEPFTWSKFDAIAAAAPGTHAGASVRAVQLLRGGQHPDGRRIEVWTSDHIDQLVAVKAHQSRTANDERDRGLGWSRENAQGLVDALVVDLLQDTGGDSVGTVQISYGSPPLSHEDGCVYATARAAGHEGVFYDRVCLTRDRFFLEASLPGLIDVHKPHDWVSVWIAESRARAFSAMRGASGL